MGLAGMFVLIKRRVIAKPADQEHNSRPCCERRFTDYRLYLETDLYSMPLCCIQYQRHRSVGIIIFAQPRNRNNTNTRR